MKKLLIILLAGVMCFTMTACDNKKPSDGDGTATVERSLDRRKLTPEQYTALNTVGTDALGRYIAEADGYRSGNKYVGIWYSLWLGQHTMQQTAIYDIEKLLQTEEGRAAVESLDNSELSRTNEFHFCSEPLFGYYNMRDEWVVTRHIELLTAAGMDYLCFDTTNAVTYKEVATLVLDTLLKYHEQGFNVPKAMFYTNSDAGNTAKKIYNDFYITDKYDDIWFAPNGSPMIVTITEDNRNASDQRPGQSYKYSVFEDIYERFDVRESQWPQGEIKHENALPWMTWNYPQEIHPELKAMSVSVAQHDPQRCSFSFQHPHSSRGYDHTTKRLNKNFAEGQNFESQWKTVFDYEARGKTVENVLLCGWNEWMAIKQPNGAGFVDVYNEEYGRDVEMSKGACGDNFFYQMTRNIRKYKLTEPKHYTYQKLNINIADSALSQWKGVKAHYRDFAGDALARDGKNAIGEAHAYVDNSNRNDITDVKVVHNAQNLYVYVKVAGEEITEYNGSDKNWMTLLLGTDGEGEKFGDWQFIINRSPSASGKTSIEKSKGGYSWESAGEAEYKVHGNVIVYSIPLSVLGVTADSCHLKIKACDNLQHPEDFNDYYVSGDCAPIGRLSYSYGY